MLNQVAQERIGKPLLVRPLGIAEDAVERLGVGLLDPAHGRLKSLAHVARDRANVTPVAAVRNLEAVVLRKQRVLVVATGLRQRCLALLVVRMRDVVILHNKAGLQAATAGVFPALKLPFHGFRTNSTSARPSPSSAVLICAMIDEWLCPGSCMKRGALPFANPRRCASSRQ